VLCLITGPEKKEPSNQGTATSTTKTMSQDKHFLLYVDILWYLVTGTTTTKKSD
jgi:hypothetical protein